MNLDLKKLPLIGLAGFILIEISLGSTPKYISNEANPASSLKDDEPINPKGSEIIILTPLPVPQGESDFDYYFDNLEDYLSDPEDEITFSPEIFDFLDD